VQRALASALCVILVLVCTPHGQTSDEQLAAEVDSLLKRAVTEGFGGAVVIDRRGQTVLSSGYGFANRQARRPFTPDTVAPIGSITKTFTALAIVQLSAERKVDLQRPLRA
jgi:CubicO group peptidase (beta-lactamase class C family)